jgi:hypothetical protein
MNIFYTEVDANLQKELNARGRSGFYDRSEKALNFMVGKIANVFIRAYEDANSASPVVGSMGGEEVRTDRFMPTGPNGFLTDQTVTKQQIGFYTEDDVIKDRNNPNIIVGNAYLPKANSFTDSSKRTPPFITAVDINIGDHSMGLLNKATIQFTIPNPGRDLDIVEQTWFRPGRYMSIDIEHPESALVSAQPTGLFESLSATTNGLLTEDSVPERDKLENLYPSWKTQMDKFIRQMSRMNAVRFEGLITQFDFQYASDGTITAAINMTGTSNVYTDISMYLKTETNPKNTEKAARPEDLKVTGSRQEFYEVLYERVKTIESNLFKQVPGLDKNAQYVVEYTNASGSNPGNTDRFILVGEAYPPTVKTYTNDSKNAQKTVPESNYNRYITFGALVHFINSFVITKLNGSVSQPQIIFTDVACFSNYYESLVSCIPEDILLLPKNSPGLPFNFEQGVSPDCNTYGDLVYYANVNNNLSTSGPFPSSIAKEWPGVYDKVGIAGKYYPSRILINLETIQDIIQSLSAKGTSNFSVTSFITAICNKISRATGDAFKLNLVSHPKYSNELMIMDARYTAAGKINDTKQVVPYSVPMFSNHPNGSIVQDFGLSAKLPQNAKSLSYVLNSGDDVSELDIAPFMNFMYNAQNVEQINTLRQRFREGYDNRLTELAASRAKFGGSPGVPELQTALYKSLVEYIKRPSPTIETAVQMSAPIFPFEATITIPGINGFKYGDVLQFEALPLRYRMNTVFSVINITHTVSNTGEWTTQLRCIMRPSIS